MHSLGNKENGGVSTTREGRGDKGKQRGFWERVSG
jgi:hypothetical protein